MAERCSAVSRACGEAVLGTASRARRWLLVEQPGPWGNDAIAESDLPTDVAAHLRSLARSLPARILLIRRTGGGGTPGTRRIVLAGASSPTGGGWLEELVIEHVRDLLELDLRGLARGGTTAGTVGGQPVLEPIYLVCTNGRHDPCCAIYGLPVARSLTDLLPERVWECSHVGGDRFAGNLVCLPEGVFYGHLDPGTAIDAVAANEAGRVLAPHCRGRSAWPFSVQAAELLVRQRLGIERLDAIRYLDERRVGERSRVRFALADGREVRVTVERGHAEPPRMLTCGSAPARPPTHTLVGLEFGSVDDA